jgi:tetratricopeptide (TPR) repeat protein
MISDSNTRKMMLKATGLLARMGVLKQVLLLACAVATLYGNFLWNPIVFDDGTVFNHPETLVNGLGHSVFRFDFRWLPYASFGWTANWLGFDLIWFRLGNLILHAAVAIALLAFVRHLLNLAWRDYPHSQSALSVDWLAFFAAMAFAIHPVTVYGVGYLIERTILMATFFVLLMLLAFMRGLETGKQPWFILSVFFYFMAVFSKEHCIMAPGVTLILALLLKTPNRELMRQLLPPFTLFLLIGIFVVFRSKGVLGSPYEPLAVDMLRQMAEKNKTAMEHPYLLSVITQSWLYFKYLFLWILPNITWMSVDMREPFATNALSWPFTLGAIAFLLWPVAGIWLLLKRGNRGLTGFAMLFPWIMFLTEMSTVRIQEPFVLYRSYLWMAGASIIVPLLISRMANKVAIVAIPLTIVILFGLSWERLTTFSHPFLLWNDAVRLLDGRDDLIGADRVYYNRGLAFWRAKYHEDALEDFNRVIKINPARADAHSNRGSVYLDQHKYQEALSEFNQATKLDSLYIRAFLGRGFAYEALHDQQAAIKDFRVSCLLENQGCDKAHMKEIPQGRDTANSNPGLFDKQPIGNIIRP